MTQLHKKLYRLSIGVLLGLIALNVNAKSATPLAVDLQATAKSAEQKNIPIVLFYTAEWCHYCHILERNILEPLITETDIENYAEFRKVSLSESGWNMISFDGQKTDMEAFAEQQRVQYTPTTVVYNSKGKIIAEPIVGLTLEEFYPGNLEKAINQGLKNLGNTKRLDIYKKLGKAR